MRPTVEVIQWYYTLQLIRYHS